MHIYNMVIIGEDIQRLPGSLMKGSHGIPHKTSGPVKKGRKFDA